MKEGIKIEVKTIFVKKKERSIKNQPKIRKNITLIDLNKCDINSKNTLNNVPKKTNENNEQTTTPNISKSDEEKIKKNKIKRIILSIFLGIIIIISITMLILFIINLKKQIEEPRYISYGSENLVIKLNYEPNFLFKYRSKQFEIGVSILLYINLSFLL